MQSDAPTTTTGDSGIQVEGPQPTTINPFDADFWDPMIDELRGFQESAVSFIPRLIVGIVALVIALAVAKIACRAIHRSLAATRADDLVVGVLSNVAR